MGIAATCGHANGENRAISLESDFNKRLSHKYIETYGHDKNPACEQIRTVQGDLQNEMF